MRHGIRQWPLQQLIGRNLIAQCGDFEQPGQIVQQLMKATDFIAEGRQFLRSRDSALEESTGIADQTCHVPDQLMRRADVGSGAKIRKSIRRSTQGFLRPIGNRSQKMFQQGSLLWIHGKSIKAGTSYELLTGEAFGFWLLAFGS